MSTNVANLILEIIGKDSASKTLKDVSGEADSLGDKFKNAAPKIQAASIAVSAAGVGLEALAQSQQEMNTVVGQNAAAIGITEGEYRKLATSLSNAGFPLEDVNALLRAGTQEGLEGKEALSEYANFWDMVGDATGLAGDKLAEGATGLRAVGIAAGNEGEALAAFGFITDKTKIGVDDFLGLLQRKGETLKEFGISANDTAAILGVMEKELGLTGKAAAAALEGGIDDWYKSLQDMAKVSQGAQDDLGKLQAKFDAGKISSSEFATESERLNKLIADSNAEWQRLSQDSMGGLIEGLGISKESFAAMSAEVEASSGVIERNAAIQDKSITATQKLKAQWDDFLFSHAGVVKSLSDFAPIMMAAGPAVNGFAGAMRLVGPASTMAATGLRSVGLALLTPPLGIIIALVAVGVAIWIFRDEIVAAISSMWETVGPILTEARDFIVGAFNSVLEFARNNWPEIVTLISGPFFPIVALATDAFGVRSAIVGAFNSVLDFMRGNWPEIVALLSGPFFPIVALATDAFGVRTALVNAFNAILDFFRGEWVGNIVGFFTGLPGRIAGAMGDVKNLLWQKGKDLIQGFVNGMTSVSIPNPLSMVPGGGIVSGALGSVPNPFRRETGGPVAANQVYLVGEKGAELFVPDSAGQIISNEQMKALSMGGTTSAVSVGQPLARKLVADFASIAPQASSAIEKYFGFIVTEAQKNFLAGEAARGDWMNDWLSHIEDPSVRAKAMEAGKFLALSIEQGVSAGADASLNALFNLVDGLMVGVDQELNGGFSHITSTTTDLLVSWRDALMDGLDEGSALSKSTIATMMDEISVALQDPALPAEARNMAATTLAALITEFQATGSLANQSLIDIVNQLVGTAAAGAAQVTSTLNTAAQAVAGAAAGSTISWSTGVPRVVPAAPAGGGGGNANNNAIGLRAVRGPSGGVADSRAAAPVTVTMQNVTINSPKDAQTAANDVAFVIAANLRARGMMVPA